MNSKNLYGLTPGPATVHKQPSSNPEFVMIRFPRYALLTFLFLAATFLSVEVWMQAIRHTSLCTTSACDVVGEYVRFGEGNLIKMGATAFWFLWALVFFGGRYDKAWIWGGASLLLFGALAFDGAILGFQFMGLKEKCLLCVLVGSILGVALCLFSWVRRSLLTALLGLAVWSGGFAANAVLDLNVVPPAITDTAFTTWENPNGKDTRHVLFFSLHCEHCSKILANLSINVENLSGKWDLACTDNKEEDLFGLSTVLTTEAGKTNPFLEILRVESLEKIPPLPVSEELRQTVRTARAYFKMKGYVGIPILVVLERPGWEMVLRGEQNIMEYLRLRGYVQRELQFNAPAPAEGNGTSS
jgi:glutaredoxin-related protein